MEIENNKSRIKSYLQRIVNILMINGGLLDNTGLYTGEMGVVFFFFYYSVYTENEAYRDYAFELLERLQDRIHEETPINYENGLAGIGSAIEFLVQEGYIEADTDAVLEDFDNRIFYFQNIPNLSIDELASISYYAIWRLSGSHSKKKVLINDILPPIVKAMDEWCLNHGLTNPLIDFFKNIVEDETTCLIHDLSFENPGWDRLICWNSPYVSVSGPSSRFLEIMSRNENDIFRQNNLDLGLHNGLAGIGMTLLSEIDDDAGYSWTSLLPSLNP